MTILVDFTTILASAKTIKGAIWHQIDQFSMGFKQSPKNSNKLKTWLWFNSVARQSYNLEEEYLQ